MVDESTKKTGRALVLAPYSDYQLSRLSECLDVRYESWMDTKMLHDPYELGTRLRLEDYSFLIVESDFVFEELFGEASSLKLVGVCRTATNQIDIDSATKHGVVVVNTPGRNAQAVAEHALGLMLSLARRIPQSHTYVVNRKWNDPTDPYLNMRGMELSGKTLGIIAIGAIGRKLARFATAIGMSVIAYDPFAVDIPDFVRCVELFELATEADFISIHAPANDETEGMVSRDLMATMKPGVIIINTSGASLVDEDALVDGLESGHIRGAAIDVFTTHPVSPNSRLLNLDNVVLTPHIGGATNETIERHSEMMTDDIVRFLSGKMPTHIVNPEAWQK